MTQRRWRRLILLAVTVFCGTYGLLVRTAAGQRLENAALRGADQVVWVQDAANDVLNLITVRSLAGAVLILASIGLMRRRPRLSLAAVGLVGMSLGLTEVFKRVLLPRPPLAVAPDVYMHNSFPSGHTTIAMSVLLALVLVSRSRFRGSIMLLCMLYALGVGSWTLIAKWHRFSDTVGADAVALGVACAASLWLSRRDLVQPADTTELWPRQVLVTLLVLVLLFLVGASLLLLENAGTDLPAGQARDFRIFLAVTALSGACSIGTALLFWWTWFRLDVTPRLPERSR
ncbi:hypothetical protein GCM10008956_39300 [Deinococcus arenae]|uniref:Phosphatidic acid phosphatase type 2/haloperoxidase domain-containing protein n=2 Tax=Deinococcaceae TaxID=183710 RepID=A0A8H9GT00_9DEIO|nr:hypothetical protein GCM10008956_39300 [Deinococcus arenae]